MYHSLIFQPDNEGRRYNTWSNWHLIPSSRPIVPQPSPVYKYVDIPGRNGSIDISDYLTGTVTYSDRKGTFTFYVDNDKRSWASRRAELASFFNGRKMKMWLEDEANYYYYGRFFLREWRTDASSNYSQVTIEYQVSPYRYLSNGEEAGL